MSVVTNTPILPYEDAEGAARWLCEAFGFSVARIVREPDGELSYIALKLGQNFILVSPATSPLLAEFLSPPGADGQQPTQTCYVSVGDVEAHCARARAADAEIALAPEADDDGAEFYVSRDPGGHLWVFGTRHFVDATRTRRSSRVTWTAGAIVAACLALVVVASALSIAGGGTGVASVLGVSFSDPNSGSKNVSALLRAEQKKRAAADLLVEVERKNLAAAHQAIADERKKLATAAEAVAREREKRVATERAIAADRKRLAAAQELVATERTRRTALAQAVASEREKRAATERAIAADRKKLAAAQELVAVERKRRTALAQAVATEQEKRSGIEQAVAGERKKLATAAQTIQDEQAKRAEAERALQRALVRLAAVGADEKSQQAKIESYRRTVAQTRARVLALRRRRQAAVMSLRSAKFVLVKRRSENRRALAALTRRHDEMQETLKDIRARLSASQRQTLETSQTLTRERAEKSKLEVTLKKTHLAVATLHAEQTRIKQELELAKATLNARPEPAIPDKPRTTPVPPADEIKPDPAAQGPPALPAKNPAKKTETTASATAVKPPEQAATEDRAQPTSSALDTTCKRAAWSRVFAKQRGKQDLKLQLTRQLCLRAEATSAPVRCLQRVMSGRFFARSGAATQRHPKLSMAQAIALCGGTHNPRKTIRCFLRRRADNQALPVAIDRCQDYTALPSGGRSTRRG